MDLYIYNKALALQNVMDTYGSLRWVRRYTECGEFELHCPFTVENIRLLAQDNIIRKKDSDEVGFIEYRNVKRDETDKENLIVKGKLGEGYLNRRIVWGREILNTTYELAMRTLVDKNCINPTDANRIINTLMLGDLGNFTGNVNFQVSYQNLLKVVESLCLEAELGNWVRFDKTLKKLKFEIFQGLDRTSSQTVNPQCIFSKEFDNILDQEYTDSIMDYRNVALVGGIGEDADRRLVTVGSGVGLDRFEAFNDQKGLSNMVDNVAMTEADYLALLSSKGNETLAETKKVQTFENGVNLNSNLRYKVDFDLGDIVTCMSKKWGISIDSRINEVEEVYEESGKEVNIVFGKEMPRTIAQKIKLL
ncbi:siphovirus ReqiPepy6 Gp37-like family protein [Acetobacterium tundrae]|uniref:Gp28/Gp37-like domain-containing protein n=1 Tax=Acetobacterium tundrae TaxID=132932 RepID=A0ABR6WIV8_9FIRM|nr:siphovirus ReqiPepy6 Gp37-like family protein [Acetobacterium tundrae]MBC3796428.1 hypothetical protein [Acetobacterium tundrae]